MWSYSESVALHQLPQSSPDSFLYVKLQTTSNRLVFSELGQYDYLLNLYCHNTLEPDQK